MGCAQSSPQGDTASVATASAPPASASAAAAKAKPSSTRTATASGQPAAHNTKSSGGGGGGSAASAAKYDSKSQATYVDAVSGVSGFKGLLSPANRVDKTKHPELLRELVHRRNSRVIYARHGGDDSARQLDRQASAASAMTRAADGDERRGAVGAAPQHAAHQVSVSRSLNDTSAAAPSGLVCVEGVALTMAYRVLVDASAVSMSTREAADSVERCVSEVFSRVDEHFNNWNKDSELCTAVNYMRSRRPAVVSEQLFALLQRARELHALTGGRFDPTVGSLSLVWREKLTDSGRPPTDDETSHLRFALGFANKVVLNEKKRTVMLDNSNTEVDLGGIAKGAAVDMLVETLQRAGFASVYVDWGSEIRATGKHPSGRPWRTVVMRPPALDRLFRLWSKDRLDLALSERDATLAVELGDGSCPAAAATSGDYFQVEKYGYHHIVSPSEREAMRAGRTSVASATVLARECVVADAVATAAMTFSDAVAAEEWLRQLDCVIGYCLMTRQIYGGDDGSSAAEASGARRYKLGVLCSEHFYPLRRNESANDDENVRAAAADDNDDDDDDDDEEEEDAAEMQSNGAYATSTAQYTTESAALEAVSARMPRALFLLTVAGEENGGFASAAVLDALASCSLSPPMVSFHITPALLRALARHSRITSRSDHGALEALQPPLRANAYSFDERHKQDIVALEARPSVILEHSDGAEALRNSLAACPRLELECAQLIRRAGNRRRGTGHDSADQDDDAVVLARVLDMHAPACAPSASSRLFRIGAQLGALPKPAAAQRRHAPAASDAPGAELGARLRELMRDVPGGVTLITMKAADRSRYALTATSTCWSVAPNRENYLGSVLTFNVQRESLVGLAVKSAAEAGARSPTRAVTVHALGKDAQRLAERFVAVTRLGDRGSDEESALAGTGYEQSLLPGGKRHGAPAFEDVRALCCRIESVAEAGDHLVVACRVEAATQRDARDMHGKGVLIYYRGAYKSMAA